MDQFRLEWEVPDGEWPRARAAFRRLVPAGMDGLAFDEWLLSGHIRWRGGPKIVVPVSYDDRVARERLAWRAAAPAAVLPARHLLCREIEVCHYEFAAHLAVDVLGNGFRSGPDSAVAQYVVYDSGSAFSYEKRDGAVWLLSPDVEDAGWAMRVPETLFWEATEEYVRAVVAELIRKVPEVRAAPSFQAWFGPFVDHSSPRDPDIELS